MDTSPSGVSPTLRRATASDAPALARVRYVFRAELGEPAESEASFLDRCVPWMATRLAGDTRWLCWVAEEDGAIVGTLWLERIEKLPNPVAEPEEHAYVTSVYVVPERRDGGIGAKLLDAALAWCREAGVDAALLWPSERSRPLYLRHGFAVRDDLLALRPVLTSPPK